MLLPPPPGSAAPAAAALPTSSGCRWEWPRRQALQAVAGRRPAGRRLPRGSRAATLATLDSARQRCIGNRLVLPAQQGRTLLPLPRLPADLLRPCGAVPPPLLPPRRPCHLSTRSCSYHRRRVIRRRPCLCRRHTVRPWLPVREQVQTRNNRCQPRASCHGRLCRSVMVPLHQSEEEEEEEEVEA